MPPGFAVTPSAVGQQPLEKMSDEQLRAAEAVADRMYGSPERDDPNSDRYEYLRHVYRARARGRRIAVALGDGTAS